MKAKNPQPADNLAGKVRRCKEAIQLQVVKDGASRESSVLYAMNIQKEEQQQTVQL